MVFAGVNDERMVLVEELGIGGQARFEASADLVIGLPAVGQVVAFENAPSVGVDDEGGMTTGVEEDGIRGFRADAVDGQELLAKDRSGGGEEMVKRPLILAAKKVDKRF